QVVLDVQAGGQHQQAPVPLTVRGADSSVPTVTDLALVPDHISPNFDAQSDVTHMTFSLGKQALVSAFLDGVSSSGAPRRIWTGGEVKVAPGVKTLTWDGTANGQPVPDGGYMLGVRARDSAGNIVESSQPMVVEDSGVPEASIVSAQIGPPQ